MSAKKFTLGRGLDVLIPTDIDEIALVTDTDKIQNILITDIKPNPNQPRREFNEQTIYDLASSIREYGVLQPVIVVRVQKGYNLVAGERRWRAAHVAKLTHIPAIVRSLQELEQIELALIENVQREDLSPLEQALSVYQLQHQYNLSLEEISKKLGKAQSTVSNLSRLLKLPEAAREALRQNKITEGHARAILALSAHPTQQDQLLSSILNNGISVREAEDYVTTVKKTIKTKDKNNDKTLVNYEKRAGHYLKLPVKLKPKKEGGDMIISYRTHKELDGLIKRFETKAE